MGLDFYSSILVETPEYANPGNEIQLETTNESYTAPIAQDNQPTYQGLLNDNSEFLSMIVSSCASYNWFPRYQFGLQRNNNNNNKLFFINLALACLCSRCSKVVLAPESTRHTKKPAEVSSPLVKRFHHFLYLIIFLIVLILMCLSYSVIIVQIFLNSFVIIKHRCIYWDREGYLAYTWRRNVKLWLGQMRYLHWLRCFNNSQPH